MENEILDSTVKKTQEMKYAGFGIRFWALLIDGILITAIGYLIWGDKVVQITDTSVSVDFQGESSLLPILYYLGSWILLSTSIGKLALGLKIVNKEGKRISIVQAIIRALVYVFLIIGCWFILGNDQKKALHDFAAGTFVVKK